MTLEQARRLLDAAIAETRPITRADADACRAVAARLRAEGFPQGALSVTDRLAELRLDRRRHHRMVEACPLARVDRAADRSGPVNAVRSA